MEANSRTRKVSTTVLDFHPVLISQELKQLLRAFFWKGEPPYPLTQIFCQVSDFRYRPGHTSRGWICYRQASTLLFHSHARSSILLLKELVTAIVLKTKIAISESSSLQVCEITSLHGKCKTLCGTSDHLSYKKITTVGFWWIYSAPLQLKHPFPVTAWNLLAPVEAGMLSWTH